MVKRSIKSLILVTALAVGFNSNVFCEVELSEEEKSEISYLEKKGAQRITEFTICYYPEKDQPSPYILRMKLIGYFKVDDEIAFFSEEKPHLCGDEPKTCTKIIGVIRPMKKCDDGDQEFENIRNIEDYDEGKVEFFKLIPFKDGKLFEQVFLWLNDKKEVLEFLYFMRDCTCEKK